MSHCPHCDRWTEVVEKRQKAVRDPSEETRMDDGVLNSTSDSEEEGAIGGRGGGRV